MYGNVKPRHWNWADAAQVNVPIPDARIRLRSGYNPEYDFKAHVLYLPQPGRDGWTYHDEHGLFLHELGHVYDYADMTPARRDAFKATAQTTCSWWAKHCYSLNRRSGQTIDLPPGEMFAEMFEACAMGMTREQVDDAGFNSYGWEPPDGSQTALCDLIRGAVGS